MENAGMPGMPSEMPECPYYAILASPYVYFTTTLL